MIERIDRKRQVLTYVAKYCFEGTLEAHKEFIPLEIVPHGSQPTYRCCVYREREAEVRQSHKCRIEKLGEELIK